MTSSSPRLKWIIPAVIVIVAILGAVWYVVLPPKSFASDTIIRIPHGLGSFATAKLLKEKGIVRSEIALHVALILKDGESRIQAGDYLFAKPLSVVRLADTIIEGNYGFSPRKITLPEGLASAEMAEVLDANLISFSKEDFLRLATQEEGYLFPDTYLFMPTATSGEVVKVLLDTFTDRLQSVSQEIAAFNKPLSDIITMASIVEEEANDDQSRKIVAGILWKRLDRNIPLQVDATFRYINGKTTEDLTLEDLKIDSPYNTYKYKGLPPGAISNPGLDAIRATVLPIDTPYIYFLTGDDGKMYYSKTLAEHEAYRKKHIKPPKIVDED